MRYITTILAGAAALAASAAYGADLPVKTERTIAPAFSWTGFYIGANAGYGWARVGDTNLSSTGSNSLSGFVGGGQLGYNYQAGSLVFGIEGDFQGSTQKRSDSGTIGGTLFTVSQKLPYFATVRGRVGVAWDRTLLYVTGGWAYVNYKVDVTALGVTASSNSSSSAWTVGGGIEQALWDRWSAKVEYLYIDTGSTNVTLFGTTFAARANDHIGRVGLNYRF